MAFDFIITDDGRVYFLEFHEGSGAFHGSSERGTPPSIIDDRRLYTIRHEDWFYYRTPRKKRFEFPLDRIAKNKWDTYLLTRDLQPNSFHLTAGSRDIFPDWLRGQTSPWIIAKPLHTDAGVGICCYSRDELLADPSLILYEHTPFVQEYIPSKFSERGHVTSLRVVSTIRYVEGRVDVCLSVPYHREARLPFSSAPKKAAMVANITSGGRYIEATKEERDKLYDLVPSLSMMMMEQCIKEDIGLSISSVFILDGYWEERTAIPSTA
jgi:hypothetical protein